MLVFILVCSVHINVSRADISRRTTQTVLTLRCCDSHSQSDDAPDKPERTTKFAAREKAVGECSTQKCRAHRVIQTPVQVSERVVIHASIEDNGVIVRDTTPFVCSSTA